MLISFIALIVGFIGSFITYVILSWKLRKKGYLEWRLDSYKPKRLQGWTSTASVSWISGSQIMFIWFFYPMNLFVNKMTKEERKYYKEGVKKELGKDFGLYWINVTLQNITSMGGVFAIILIGLGELMGVFPK